MKLVKLLSCDIFRDGGSLEGIWLTDDNQEWAITLLIVPESLQNHHPTYELYNTEMASVAKEQRIQKDSPQELEIREIIQQWLEENTDTKTEQLADPYNYYQDLIAALQYIV